MAGGALLTFLPQVTSSGTAGLALLLMGVAAAASRFGAGHLADAGPRGGHGWLAPLLVVTAAGTTACAWGARDGTTGWLLAGALLCGTGYGALQNLTLVSAFHRAGPGRVDETSTVWNVGFDGGTALGAVVVGVVASVWGFPIGVRRRGRGLRARAGGRATRRGRRRLRLLTARASPATTSGHAAGGGTWWPMPSTTSSRAPGTAAASASACGSGNIGSWAPCTTRVGTAIRWTSSGSPSSSPATSQWLPAAAGSWLRSNIAPGCGPRPGLVEARPGEDPLGRERPGDDRLAVGPVRVRRRVVEPPGELGRRPRQPRVVDSPGGGRRDERERGDQLRPPQRERLGDPAAHGEPDQVRRRPELLDEGGAVAAPARCRRTTGSRACPVVERPVSRWS